MGVYNNNNNNSQTTSTSTTTTTNANANAINESTNPPHRTSGKTKLVVRGLPHNLSLDGFLSIIEEKFKDRYVNLYYVIGKQGYKVNTPSRAYIYFKDAPSAFDFLAFFDGHTFVNSKGQEERAQVEYAPYQKNFKPRRKPDPRAGGIEKDPDFLRFQQKLLEPQHKLPSAEIQLEKKMREEANGTATITPPPMSALLEDLRARRAARLVQGNNPTGPRSLAPVNSLRKLNAERLLERKKIKKMEKERERKKRKEEKLLAKLQQQQHQGQGQNVNSPNIITDLSMISNAPNLTNSTNTSNSTNNTNSSALQTVSPSTAYSQNASPNDFDNTTYEKKKKQPSDWKRNREDRRRKKEERDTTRKYNALSHYNQPQNPPVATQVETNANNNNNNNTNVVNTNAQPVNTYPTQNSIASFPKQIRNKGTPLPKSSTTQSKTVLEPGSITIQQRPSSQTPTTPQTQTQQAQVQVQAQVQAQTQPTHQPPHTSQITNNPTQTQTQTQPAQPQNTQSIHHTNTEQNYASPQGGSQYYQKGYNRNQTRDRGRSNKYNVSSNTNTNTTTTTTTTSTTTVPQTSYTPAPAKIPSEQSPPPQQTNFSSNLSSSAPLFVPSSVLPLTATPFTPSSKTVESTLSKPIIMTKTSTFSPSSTAFTPSTTPTALTPPATQTTSPTIPTTAIQTTTTTTSTTTNTSTPTTSPATKPAYSSRRPQQPYHNYSQGYPQYTAAAPYAVNPSVIPQYPNVQYEQYGTVYYPPPSTTPTTPPAQPYQQYPAKSQGRYQNFME